MVPCESQAANPRLIASIHVVVASVAMYEECWLAWLSKVCNFVMSFEYNDWIIKSSPFCKFGVGGIRNA